jgi:hypothetical protein
MSNPLLHPDDPRFHRPEIRDAAGQNRFADQSNPQDRAAENLDVYAAAASDINPFAAQYPVQQTSRASLLLVLGGIGWGAAAVGAFSFTGWFDAGWLSPLLGLGPAVAAWLWAHEELKAIRTGAIAEHAEPQAQHAFWLGLTGLIACIAVVVAMICWEMQLLPGV